ncbi:helix-turn-helix domain-containing protein [Leptospira sp. 201903071]|uniref:helix-turn-helix domain-containing protein n=1 Tax=Leptospira ainazelensis TaxID=2810034 RepID=UPI001962653C|nr:helix-turn-helix domain-containing protein [Leptospira ainazelensis]MBM9499714.1 helix-turn-helix domain-containing protein [Leptospira ainazelensis]
MKKKKNFEFAPLFALLNLPYSEAIVWIVLWTFQGNNANSWPTLNTISRRVGGRLKPRRISQLTNKLVKRGWLIKQQRGNRRSNIYVVTIPSDLLFVPDFTSLPFINSENKLSAIPSNKEPTWQGFLNWANERLTPSSKKILKEIEIQIDNNSIRVLNPLPESVSLIVRKYFSEECHRKIKVEFMAAPEDRQLFGAVS